MKGEGWSFRYGKGDVTTAEQWGFGFQFEEKERRKGRAGMCSVCDRVSGEKGRKAIPGSRHAQLAKKRRKEGGVKFGL